MSSIEEILEKLRRTGTTFCVAESCTGGAICSAATAIAGASDVFRGGVVAYDNRVKQKLLFVDPALIAEHGAVSAEVAFAMYEGVLKAIGGDFAIAVTGIAGPGGGTEAKPVGTVFAAVGPRENPIIWNVKAKGTRAEIIQETVRAVYGVLDQFFPT